MTTSPRPMRMRPDDRRAEILEVARRLLLESGYAAVGLAEIATAGEVSRPSVYRYFPDGRTDVFVAVVDSLGAGQASPPLLEVPWQLEELRVATFAQPLATKRPGQPTTSAKRIAATLDAATR